MLVSIMDEQVSEIEDAGDIWLAFWVCSALGGLMAIALIAFLTSSGWALAGAVPVGFASGWVICRIRPARRFVSNVVLLFGIW